jgi:hypothetical protein
MDNDSSAGIERVGIPGWGRMGAGIGRHLIAGGGERGAEQASLRLMCGGPEAVIDRCRPALGVDMPLTESLIPLMEELTAEQLRALR